jgi:DNA-directed RNA polymerase sigma subunit (sigma70/sigma32)
MTFAAKIDDKQLNVDLSCTNLADILQYCKAKEQLILIKKFGLQTGKEMPLQQIGMEFGMTRERARQIEKQALMRFRRLFVGNEKYLKIIAEAEKILISN